jgi:hypothetical protein
LASFLEEYILEKIKKFTLVMLVQGYMQMGKSTFTWYLMDSLSRKKFGVAWDYKKYCARSLEEFIDMIDKYNNKLIVFEEASKDISIQKWYNDMNFFFNVIMQTQAYKHNLVVLVFPHSASISKRQRYFINLGIEILERIDIQNCHATVFKPTIYKRRFWRLDENDLYYQYWNRESFVKYNKKDLKEAGKYTKWLEQTLKQDTMNDIKRMVKERNEKMNLKKQVENFKYPEKPVKITW